MDQEQIFDRGARVTLETGKQLFQFWHMQRNNYIKLMMNKSKWVNNPGKISINYL